MTQDKTIVNILKDRAIPDYIESEYPLFVSFIDAYHEFLEQEKNSTDISLNLRDYRDIDATIDEFIDHFRREYMINIPTEIITDKRLLAKQIKNFYLNKGNESSYKFLFRALYDEDIDFYYPKVDVLRASDGKWYEQRSIKVTLSDRDNLLVFNSKRIVGETSGATAVVENSLNYVERGETIVELSLSEIRGEFQYDENIIIEYVNDNDETVQISERILEIYTDIDITASGSGYAIGDTIIIRDKNDDEISKATVKKVSKSDITGIDIIEEGVNYSGDIKKVTRFYALPSDYTLDDDYLPDTAVDGTGSASGTDYTQYTFDELIDLQEIPGVGDTIDILDSANSFGSGALGRVTVVGNDGNILETVLLSNGEQYESPRADIITVDGKDAVLDIIGGGGAISRIILESFPVVIDDDIDSNDDFIPYPDFTSAGDGNAQGKLVSNTLAQYPGRYLNEDGHLSSSKKLQDSFFYQDYSYVIKAGISIEKWRDIIKKIIHPAGFEVFGEIQIKAEIDSTVSVAENNATLNITYELDTASSEVEESSIEIV